MSVTCGVSLIVLDYSKQDAATTTAHINCLIESSKTKKTDVNIKYSVVKY